MRLARHGPADGRHQRRGRRLQPSIEHLRDEDLGLGRLFANCRGHCGAVPQSIDEVVREPALGIHAHSVFDTANMRVQRVHAAVHDDDADATGGAGAEPLDGEGAGRGRSPG